MERPSAKIFDDPHYRQPFADLHTDAHEDLDSHMMDELQKVDALVLLQILSFQVFFSLQFLSSTTNEKLLYFRFT